MLLIYSGNGLEIRNKSCAYWSGKPASLSGNSIGMALCDERCTLKRSTLPSLLAKLFIPLAADVGSPSVDSPSVIFMAIGGKQSGYFLSHPERIPWARDRAWHIGVPPLATESNQMGNLIV